MLMIIISQLNLIMCLASDLIDLGKIEHGRFTVREAECKIGDAIDYIKAIF